MRPLILISAYCSLHCGCSMHQSLSEDDSFEPFPEAVVEDVIPLGGEPPYRLQDIAFAIAHFEIGADKVKAAIERGDERPTYTSDTWTYQGDGAQPSVRIRRLSRPDELPLRVRIKLGPVSSGFAKDELPLYVYDFERASSGWKKVGYRKEFVSLSDISEVKP